MHMLFVYGECAYLELGLRGGMWIFIKNTNFFHMSYPVGFAIEWFLVCLEFDLWGVCFGYDERS